ncbi:MAG: hypothetical protein GY822_22340 [Deltaproteobacteria bacterium]|nr:hypothetical protein [Deltaproteobacteria bacterium]
MNAHVDVKGEEVNLIRNFSSSRILVVFSRTSLSLGTFLSSVISFPSTLFAARLQVLFLATVFASGCSGIIVESDAGSQGTDRGVVVDGFSNVVTPRAECGADSIRETEQDERCATCEGDVSQEICGSPVAATCIEQENLVGDPCRICISDQNEVLFDSCNREMSADFFDDVECREVRREEGGEITWCELCSQPDGRVVSQFCHPDFDECHDEEIDGILCTVCTFDGQLAFQECVPEVVTPSFCVGYGDENGSCTDCFDDDNELVFHDCDVSNEPSSNESCLDWVRPDGVYCSECYDAGGNVVEAWCEDVGAQPEECTLIILSENSCGVCINSFGNITFSECLPNECYDFFSDGGTPAPDPDVPGEPPADGGVEPSPEDPPVDDRLADICLEPVPCEVYYSVDGVVCAECQGVNGELESSCAESSSALFCSVENQSVQIDPPQDAVQGCSDDADCVQGERCFDGICAGNDAPVVGTEGCIVCRDRNGEEVYRECDSGAGPAPAPLQCFYEEGALGLCEVCFKSDTGELVYDSCTNEECVFTNGRVLTDTNGDLVSLPTSSVDTIQLATASCEACQDGSEQCSLEDYCDAGLVTDEDLERCNAPRVRLFFALRQCSNPWEGNGDPLTSAAVMGWALGNGQLIFTAIVSGGADVSCQECSCEPGQVIDVIVAESSLPFFIEAGFASPSNAPAP